MICGNCPLAQFQDTPHVDLLGAFKCSITTERHYYSDLCNCENARVLLVTEQEKIYEMVCESLLNIEPSYPNEINMDLPDDITLDTIKVAAHEYPFKLNQIDVEKLSEYDKKPPLAAAVDTIIGATRCLVCGEDVMIAASERTGPRICSKCKKAILYIRDKFEKELEHYEM